MANLLVQVDGWTGQFGSGAATSYAGVTDAYTILDNGTNSPFQLVYSPSPAPNDSLNFTLLGTTLGALTKCVVLVNGQPRRVASLTATPAIVNVGGLQLGDSVVVLFNADGSTTPAALDAAVITVIVDPVPNGLVDMLPRRITANPLWADLQRCIQQVTQDLVLNPVAMLRNFYDPDALEAEFLSILASTLGFQARSNLFSEVDYRRLIKGLYEYYSQSGTAATPRFISYCNNSIYGFVIKWSQDYSSFFDTPAGPTIYEGGSWFPTPHVDVVYDGEAGILNTLDVEELFYALAPIHLVLEGVVAKFTATAPFAVAIAVRDIYIYSPTVVAVPDTVAASATGSTILTNEDGSIRTTEDGSIRILD